MMDRRTLLLLLVCSVALNLGFAGAGLLGMTDGAAPDTHAGCPFGRGDAHLYGHLGLDDAQLERIRPIAADFHGREAEIRAGILGLRSRLLDEMARETPDMAVLDGLLLEIGAGQNRLQRLVMLHVLDMRTIMTPEQGRAFFQEMRRNFNMRNLVER